MNNIVKNTIRFVLFIFVQVFILDKVPALHQFIKPSLYFLFLLWLPFSINRIGLMLLAFLFGIVIDYFTGVPGFHAAPCVLIAVLRPIAINILLPQKETESIYTEPSIRSMGLAPYSMYVLILTISYHFYLVLIEWIQLGNLLFFAGKVVGSVVISMLLIFITEMLFSRTKKYRTA